jgi:hypothetical protein
MSTSKWTGCKPTELKRAIKAFALAGYEKVEVRFGGPNIVVTGVNPRRRDVSADKQPNPWDDALKA